MASFSNGDMLERTRPNAAIGEPSKSFFTPSFISSLFLHRQQGIINMTCPQDKNKPCASGILRAHVERPSLLSAAILLRIW